jgi:hypothetical protein
VSIVLAIAVSIPWSLPNEPVPSAPDFASNSATTPAAISDIVSEIPDIDALIIDLRHNSGRHPGTTAFVLSCLLDGAPAHLIGFVDPNGTVKNWCSTTTEAELPKNAVRFGGSKPLLAAFLLQKQ